MSTSVVFRDFASCRSASCCEIYFPPAISCLLARGINSVLRVPSSYVQLSASLSVRYINYDTEIVRLAVSVSGVQVVRSFVRSCLSSEKESVRSVVVAEGKKVVPDTQLRRFIDWTAHGLHTYFRILLYISIYICKHVASICGWFVHILLFLASYSSISLLNLGFPSRFV